MLSSPAALRNREPISLVLEQYLGGDSQGTLFEVGSGTAEHAVYMAEKFSNLVWITSDVERYHEHIQWMIQNSTSSNLRGPEAFEVGQDHFPPIPIHYVYSANTLHIMSWQEDQTLFSLLGEKLKHGALVFFYGPFNRQGEFTSPSNQEFDAMLRERDPRSGIRNLEDVQQAMTAQGFKFVAKHDMPANNMMLVFTKA